MDEVLKLENYLYLVGKSYSFDDGDSMTIIQVKRRDDGPWVTYHVQQGPGIPRKMVMPIEEFIDLYGYLFNEDLS